MSKSTRVMLLALGLALSPAVAACERATPAETGEAPAQVEEIPGSEVKKVIFTEDAAAAIGVETAPVAQGEGGGQLTVPYGAVIYYVDGSTWTYTEPGEREFVRVPIKVESIAGDIAILTDGPPVGTPVVVVGAPEVLGAELEIDGEQ